MPIVSNPPFLTRLRIMRQCHSVLSKIPFRASTIRKCVLITLLTASVWGGWGARGQGQSEPRVTRPSSNQPVSQSLGMRPILSLGDTGSGVAELQSMLTLLGYYQGAIDGQYQDATEAAVANFQRAAGLTVDGIVGPTTWTALLPSPPANQSAPRSLPVRDSSMRTTSLENPSPQATLSPSASPSPQPAPSPQSEDDDDSPTLVTLPILRLGMAGPAIERLQERLRGLGVYPGLIDGIFGSQTEAAVIAIQSRANLDPDGIVGPETWTILLR
ncbi:MAG: peptidoglycan-binding domain-containing protein [Elainellaceae cyanobacterium]